MKYIFPFLDMCQLRKLGASQVMDILRTVIPKNWLSTKQDLVLWYPGASGQPPLSWLKEIWKFLRAYDPKLQSARDISLFPVDNITEVKHNERIRMARINPDYPLMLVDNDTYPVTDDMLKLLIHLGMQIIYKLPGYIESHPEVIGKYVHVGSPTRIMYLLCKLCDQLGVSSIISRFCSYPLKAALEDFKSVATQALMSANSKLKPSLKFLLKKFPLFKTIQDDKNYVSGDNIVVAIPEGNEKPPVLPKMRIILLTNSEEYLAKQLELRVLSKPGLIKEIIIPELLQKQYSPEEVDKIMEYIMQLITVGSYGSESRIWIEMLRDFEFVPNENGDRHKPCDLFDPSCSTILSIFEGESVFPVQFYGKEPYLSGLRQMGLKNEHFINADTIFTSVCKIEESLVNNSTGINLAKKSGAIVEFLLNHPSLLDSGIRLRRGKLKDVIRDKTWIVSAGYKPSNYPLSLDWYRGSMVHRPAEIYKNSDAFLIGSVRPVLLNSVYIHGLPPVFDKTPQLSDVVGHFKLVIERYCEANKSSFLQCIESVHAYLQKCHPQRILQALKASDVPNWIWHGNGFTSPDRAIIEKYDIDMLPYIHVIPSEVKKFSNLFISCGVKENCTESMLVDVLQMIENKHSLSKCADCDRKRDLNLACQILKELEDNIVMLSSELRNKILVPVHSSDSGALKFVLIAQCVYSDRFTYFDDLPNEDGEDRIYLVHPKISTKVAKGLGIPSHTSRALGEESFGAFEACGQGEPLTRRLNRLLQDYRDGFSIPKELIQNADDARATEVHFLYDERANTDLMTSLLDPGMQSCQGPALWAFNNAVFSDEDFENITKLSGATKEQQSDKIGRFGLGFNSVYNITDVPSFVSRDKLVIFDPHTTYLGEAIKDRNKPGLKIDMTKRRKILKSYEDQLKPYNGIFGCNMDLTQQVLSCNGTLFRFPLRTREQAAKSEIKDLHYNSSEIKKLLQMLIKGGHDLLLFTQHIRKMSVYHLQAEAKSPNEMCKLATISWERVGTSNQISKMPILQIASTAMKALEFPRNRLTQDLSTSVSSLFKTNVNVTGYGQFNFNLGISLGKCKEWFVHSCIGKLETLEKARQIKGLAPCSSVAINISITRSKCQFYPLDITPRSDNYGRLFCYLPLPFNSGLPVHINGSFAVDSNRQTLHRVSDDEKYSLDKETSWNIALFKDTVARSYLGALKDLSAAMDLSVCIENWYELWPTLDFSDGVNANSDCLKSMVQSFYHQIVNSTAEWRIFPSRKGWLGWKDIMLLDQRFYEYSSLERSATNISDLFYADATVVKLPMNVVEVMKAVGLQDYLASSTLKLNYFLRNVLFSNVERPELKSTERDTLVLFCLNMVDDVDVKEILRRSKCIPTYPNGKLKQAKDLVEPNSKVAALYSRKDEVFPMGSKFENEVNLVKLRDLGMSFSEIQWENLLERAQSVEAVSRSSHEMACQRARKVCEFLEEKVKFENTEKAVFQERFRCVKFLPVLHNKGSEGNLQWGGDKFINEFLSGKEIYPQKLQHLLGCNEPVIDETPGGCNELGSNVLAYLGIRREPTLEQAICQLETVAFFVNCRGFLDRSCADFIARSQMVKRVTYKVYQFLNRKAKENEHLVEERLSEKCTIFLEDKFLKPDRVAFKLAFDADPYLYKLPDSIASYYPFLMKVLGVSLHFTSRQFTKVLLDIENSNQGNALDQKQLELVLKVVNTLYTSGDELDSNSVIYGPDCEGILRDFRKLCLKDVAWWPNEPGITYVHERIPYSVALHLGAVKIRDDYLERHSTGIGLPFGQHEKLTNRLNRILQTYPCDQEILKELLQNADDAGATELHFVLDPRTHGTERIFSPKSEALQGPALLVYNNSVFTEEDIQGIQSLGQGSKTLDPFKTGQYGIGFNVVYHLTDAPSMLTYVEGKDDVLCLFDPHCRYYEGATHQYPGRMIEDARRKLRTRFTDVNSSYLPNTFKESRSTVFRLPLRTKSDSKISSKVIGIEGVRHLMEQFKLESRELLLFLNHVKKINLSEIDLKSGQLKGLYSVQSTVTHNTSESKQAFITQCQAMAEIVRNRTGMLNETLSSSHIFQYNIQISDTVGFSQNWAVVQKIGFEEGYSMPESVQQHISHGDLSLLPKGGIAVPISQQKEKKKMKVFCLLPLPIETELPVQINGHFVLDNETRKKLWDYKEDAVKYKYDWNCAIIRGVILPCYIFWLLKVSKSVKQKCTISQAQSMLISIFNLFPNLSKVEGIYEKLLSTNFYQQLHEHQVCVLPVLKPICGTHPERDGLDTQREETDHKVHVLWYPSSGEDVSAFYYSKSYLFDHSEQFLKLSKDEASKDNRIIKSFLLNVGMNFHELPSFIVKSFEKAEVSLRCLDSEAVLSYIRSHPMTNEFIDCSVTETSFREVKIVCLVLQFCIKSIKNPEILIDSPLLVTGDGFLRKFETANLRFDAYNAQLIPSRPDLFVHRDIMYVLNQKFHQNEEIRVIVKGMELHDLSLHLPSVLPSKLNDKNQPVPWKPSKHSKPDKNWIYTFWRFLAQELSKTKDKGTSEPSVKEIKERPRNCQGEAQELSKTKDRGTSEPSIKEIKERLRPLSEWCLLPASRTTRYLTPETFLVPLNLSHCVLDMRAAAEGGMYLIEILKTLRVLELNHRVLGVSPWDVTIPSIGSKLAAKLVASVNDGKLFVRTLYWQYQNHSNIFENLQVWDAKYLLKHFFKIIQNFSKEDKEMLSGLPLFQGMDSKLCSVNNQMVYMVPSEIPNKGLQDFSEKFGIVFLKKDIALEELYDFLGFNTYSVLNLYIDIIFRNIESFSDDDIFCHLSHIKHAFLDNPNCSYTEKKKLLGAMKNLRFLRRGDYLLLAEDFYDPDHPVFSALLLQDLLLQEPYSDPFWIDILRSIGLVQKISSELFLKFVIEVSELKNVEEIKKKSSILLQHLASDSQLQDNPTLLKKISTVKFIISDDTRPELADVYPPKCKKGCLIAFKDSQLIDNIYLSWTTSIHIPSYVKEIDTLPFRELGVCMKPEITEVVAHLVNVLRSRKIVTVFDGLKEIPSEVKPVFHCVIQGCYEFIHRNKEHLDSHLKNELNNIAFVLVDDGNKLAQPFLTYTNPNQDEIKPYLWKVPVSLGSYFELFARLGVNQQLSADQCAFALSKIREDCNDAVLDPNSQQSAYTAIRFLLQSLKSKQCLTSEVLYLPTATPQNNTELVSSTSLIYKDDYRFDTRLMEFQGRFLISTCCANENEGVKIIDELMTTLPNELRPKRLSDVIDEKLAEAITVESSSQFNQVIETLQSPEFLEGLVRLVRYQHRHSKKDILEDLNSLQQILSNVKVFNVKEIVTALFMDEEEIEGSRSKSEVFMEITKSSEPNVRNIYMCRYADDLGHVCGVIASYLTRILGELLSLPELVSLLGTLINTRPANVHDCLDKMGIPRDTEMASSLTTGRPPSPGDFVSLELHHLLRNQFDTFKEGEFVAYEVEDPSIYGETGQATYILAEVLKKIADDGRFESVYTIIISRDGLERTVRATELYKFTHPERVVQRAVAVYDGPTTDSSPQSFTSASQEEVLQEISDTLKEAWNLDEEQRKRIIKRLYLCWHPDKNNSEKEDFCNAACKHIQSEVRRLEQGLVTTPSKDDFENWDRRAQSHYSASQAYRESYRQSQRSHTTGVPPTFQRQNPQPGEARRWYRQAAFDLDAAASDFRGPSYEWICFKCHQVSPKFCFYKRGFLSVGIQRQK